MTTTIAPSFTAGGLASGLDTNSIIDGLVKLEQQPITTEQNQQAALKSQVSALGDLASKLSALESAAKALGDGGVLGVKATSANTSFSAAPGTGAAAGDSAVQVRSLATAAKQRSAAFGADDTVSGGSLDLVVDGQDYPTQAWDDGATLADVADRIRASGAPVTATILFDGTSSYLSITKRDTGFPPGTDPSQALVVQETTTGGLGHPLGLAPLKAEDGSDLLPTNATFTIDGLAFTRTSNVVSDALPGTTLTLKAAGGPAEDLTLENDVAATKQKLQTYVDAYNAAIGLVQKQLSPADGTDRSATLTGDATVRALQQRLQGLSATQVPGLGTVRTLADLGVKTNRDGSLTLDDAALSAAIARDPAAVDGLFSAASTGLSAVVTSAVEDYVKPDGGLLTLAQSGLGDSVKRMDDDIAKLQARVDAYRAMLVEQFTAMEQVVSQYKSIGTYLTNQSQQQSK